MPPHPQFRGASHPRHIYNSSCLGVYQLVPNATVESMYPEFGRLLREYTTLPDGRSLRASWLSKRCKGMNEESLIARCQIELKRTPEKTMLVSSHIRHTDVNACHLPF